MMNYKNVSVVNVTKSTDIFLLTPIHSKVRGKHGHEVQTCSHIYKNVYVIFHVDFPSS